MHNIIHGQWSSGLLLIADLLITHSARLVFVLNHKTTNKVLCNENKYSSISYCNKELKNQNKNDLKIIIVQDKINSRFSVIAKTLSSAYEQLKTRKLSQNL